MVSTGKTATTPAATETVATKTRAKPQTAKTEVSTPVVAGPEPGQVETAPPIARVLKAQAEGTTVAPVYVNAPDTNPDWFSTASTPPATVTPSRGE